MTELLYKELSFAMIGAAMEVHKTLGQVCLKPCIKRHCRMS